MKLNQAFLLLAVLAVFTACDPENDLASSESSYYYDSSGAFSNSYTDLTSGTEGERYNEYEENPFVEVADQPISTFTIDCRYKQPDEDQSQLITFGVNDQYATFSDASENQRFTAMVAGFGMLLWDSKYKENMTYDDVLNWLDNARSYDPQGYREELRTLIGKARKL